VRGLAPIARDASQGKSVGQVLAGPALEALDHCICVDQVIRYGIGRLRGARIDHQITRCDGGQRRADLAYEPEGEVKMRKRRACGHDVVGSNDHAAIIENDFRIARPEKWSQPPTGRRLSVIKQSVLGENEGARASGGRHYALGLPVAQQRPRPGNVSMAERTGQGLWRLGPDRRHDDDVWTRQGRCHLHRNLQAVGRCHTAPDADDACKDRSRQPALLPPEFSRYRKRILQRGKAGVENPVERENVDKHGRNTIKNVDLAKCIDDLLLLSSGSSLHQQRGDRW
jgi:hypothetical protein